MTVKDFADILISFVFPHTCVSCRSITDNDKCICEKCLKDLKRVSHEKRCIKCGCEKPNCDCKSHIYYFEAVVFPYYNEGSAKNAVYRYKFSKKIYYAGIIADEMLKAFYEEYCDFTFDYIAYVPSSLRSKLSKGFNQSKLLAKIISKELGIPLLKNSIACKPFKPYQHNFDYKERFAKVNGQYTVKTKINAENVLLIDDIKTTGATLNICSKILLCSGAEKVYCLTALGGKREDGENEKSNIQ